jgi:hypothetical protein
MQTDNNGGILLAKYYVGEEIKENWTGGHLARMECIREVHTTFWSRNLNSVWRPRLKGDNIEVDLK